MPSPAFCGQWSAEAPRPQRPPFAFKRRAPLGAILPRRGDAALIEINRTGHL